MPERVHDVQMNDARRAVQGARYRVQWAACTCGWVGPEESRFELGAEHGFRHLLMTGEVRLREPVSEEEPVERRETP